VARENALVQFRRAQDLQQKGLIPQSEFDNAQANSDSARAKYDQAEASLQQIEAQGASAAAQLEQVRAQLQQAQADLDRTLLNLEYCNIYSPVDGVVISRNVDVGQTIASSLQAPTLFTIANDLSQMQVNANVDEADIGTISAAQGVEFTVDAYPSDVFPAQIAEIRLSPQTVQNVVTYSVILTIENTERKLRPGMTANISMTVDERAKVVKIPNAALRYTPPGQTRPILAQGGELAGSGEEADSVRETSKVPGAASALAPGQKWDPAAKIRFSTPKKIVHRPAIVWVLNPQNQPEMRELVVGITDGSMTEVVSGLGPGDTVVVDDSTQASASTAQRGFGFGPPGGGRGPF
jgi:HlyD family secretion protein